MSERLSTITTTTLDGEPCAPVTNEIGNPPEVDLLEDFSDVLADVAYEAEAAHTRNPMELDTGEAAKRAQLALGCAGCILAEVCPTKGTLDTRIDEGEKNAELLPKLQMIATSPAWLTDVRLVQNNMTKDELEAKIKTPESTLAALEDGSLDVDAFVGDVKNSPEKMVSKKNIPELANFASIDPDAVLSPHNVETKNGDHFVVIDASNEVGFHESAPEGNGYNILLSKLLGRMSAQNAQGNPLVLTVDPNNTAMQKSIRRLDNSDVFEMRMGGKNRLYFSVARPQDRPDLTARIIILGAHGGDEKTQQNFINRVIPAK